MKKIIGIVASIMFAASLFSGASTATAAVTTTLGGGSPILILRGGNSAFACTLTTIGYDANKRLIGLTAGHCGTTGQRIISERFQANGQLGKITYVSKKNDIAVITFDKKAVKPTTTVGRTRIRSISTSLRVSNGPVCKQGRTTGRTCGTTWYSTNRTHITSLCVSEGDSGAPLVRGDKLIGIITAYYFVSCSGTETGVNIGAVLNDISAAGYKNFIPAFGKRVA